VLDDVAVPDELAGRVELGAHPRDLPGVGDHGVLEARLPRLRRCRRRGKVDLDGSGVLPLRGHIVSSRRQRLSLPTS
jgi:hypothetical protein